MAADGAWPGGGEPRGVRTERALDELRLVLDRLESRLADLDAGPLTPRATAELVGSLDRLAAQLAARDEADAARGAELLGALAALSRRLDAEAVSSAPRDPALVRGALWLGGASALASLVLAGLSLLETPVTPPNETETAAPSIPSDNPAPSGPSALVVRTDLPIRGRTAADGAALPPPVARSDYAEVVAALGRGNPLALSRLGGLADGGDVEAQLHLASLYETGGGGLPRDLAAARLWTRRAAEGGDRIAMHNLGLFLAQGDGGVREPREAAVWFRRAAERGVVDSQYNLGLLHETGQGVPANLGEAYRWFTVAANAGDLKARRKQIELEARLTPLERGAMDRMAAAFRPDASVGAPAPVAPPAVTITESQALLARRGYFLGPADGRDSAAYREAVEAYVRDQARR